MRFLLLLSLALAAWPSVYVRPALAQANTCAAIDPSRGGAALVGVTFADLLLQPGDTVTLSGGNGLLNVITPAEGSAGVVNINVSLTDGSPRTAVEASTTFVATTAGRHLFGSAFDAAATSLVEGTFTCAASVPQTNITTSSQVMVRETSHNIYTGVTTAIGERFAPVTQARPQVVLKGFTNSVYTSINGLAAAAQAIRTHRLEMYDDASDAQQAIDLAFGAVAPRGESPEGLPDHALGFGPVGAPGASQSPFNAWVRGSVTLLEGDGNDGHIWTGVIGADYLLTDNVLIGLLAGYEDGSFEFETTGSDFDGVGYTVGGYFGARLAETVILETFLTHTWLDYDKVIDTARGSTSASRFLASFNLTGTYNLSESWFFEPNARAFVAHEVQDAFTLSNGTQVVRNTIDTGRISVGPRFRYLFNSDNGSNWSVFASAHGEYDLSSETQTNSTLADFDGLLTARLATGIDGLLSNKLVRRRGRTRVWYIPNLFGTRKHTHPIQLTCGEGQLWPKLPEGRRAFAVFSCGVLVRHLSSLTLALSTPPKTD